MDRTHTTRQIASVATQMRWSDGFAETALNENASLITGSVCGVRVENVDDPLMQEIRYLGKLVDELARGRAMDKILRAAPASS